MCVYDRGGLGGHQGLMGQNGTISGKACPKGLYGVFCEVNISYVLVFS